MRTGKWVVYSVTTLVGVGVIVATLSKRGPEVAYMPCSHKVLNDSSTSLTDTYDLWGQSISKQKAAKLMTSDAGRSVLSPHHGAVKVDAALLKVGREAFYKETFGNERFLTDVLGLVDGPITIPNLTKAIIQLRGRGTTNLQVEVAKTVTVGGRTFKKGTKIDTGIDVPKGSFLPLGMPIKFEDGRLKAGVSCAACHATVDGNTGKVIEGAPNADLNEGLLLAMATNSAAYYTHSDVSNITKYANDKNRMVVTTDGTRLPLPDPKALENAVDKTFLKWTPGNFDSTIDIKSNPSQIPDSFTLGDHPYGWSGFAAIGAFKGLSSFSNNVHAQNSDSLSQADLSKALFGVDKEVYLGTILQNAANPKYRYNPNSGKKPSEFFASVDPTPGIAGMNEMIEPPSYPKVTLVAPDGLIVSSPGHKVNEQNNGEAAWQNTLVPPTVPIKVDRDTMSLGCSVFNRAGCISCHAGPTLTNHRVILAPDIGTDGSRAMALKKTEKVFGESYIQSPDTSVPIQKGANILKVPTPLDPKQIRAAFAHGNSPGGYKVPSLIGLYWTTPFLHDGAVAVGPDADTQIGVPGTLMKGIRPDPYNSLRAMVDKDLRTKVIAANRSSEDLQQTHVQGIGHEFWVDKTTGFTKREQQALIQFLLTYNAKEHLVQAKTK